MFDDEDVTQKMAQAGADGFVSKSESSSELLKTIYEVAERGVEPLGEISEMK